MDSLIRNRRASERGPPAPHPTPKRAISVTQHEFFLGEGLQHCRRFRMPLWTLKTKYTKLDLKGGTEGEVVLCRGVSAALQG